MPKKEPASRQLKELGRQKLKTVSKVRVVGQFQTHYQS